MRGDEGFGRVLLLIVLALLAGVSLAAFEVVRRVQAPGPQGLEQVVWIERGDTLGDVADKLGELGVVAEGSRDLFYYYGRGTGLGEELRSGEFVVPPHASMKEVARILREADPLLRFVTVPEGVTVDAALAILEEAPVLEGEVTRKPAEGTILPETYAYERGETRDALVGRMVEAHNALLEELWPDRARDLPYTTKEEVIILASIVEKETAVPEERPQVAAVFVNRLRRGMRLQSDPTIIYGLTGGEPLGRGIYKSELEDATNPYNTYRRGGLPPTPICNPGRDSIAAVLNPAKTNDLYFVADGNGGHVFASTLREHNANVARWRAIERARNGQ